MGTVSDKVQQDYKLLMSLVSGAIINDPTNPGFLIIPDLEERLQAEKSLIDPNSMENLRNLGVVRRTMHKGEFGWSIKEKVDFESLDLDNSSTSSTPVSETIFQPQKEDEKMAKRNEEVVDLKAEAIAQAGFGDPDSNIARAFSAFVEAADSEGKVPNGEEALQGFKNPVVLIQALRKKGLIAPLGPSGKGRAKIWGVTALLASQPATQTSKLKAPRPSKQKVKEEKQETRAVKKIKVKRSKTPRKVHEAVTQTPSTVVQVDSYNELARAIFLSEDGQLRSKEELKDAGDRLNQLADLAQFVADHPTEVQYLVGLFTAMQ
jgi:hypothetical protein